MQQTFRYERFTQPKDMHPGYPLGASEDDLNAARLAVVAAQEALRLAQDKLRKIEQARGIP
jgi:hypothetical protein